MKQHVFLQLYLGLMIFEHLVFCQVQKTLTKNEILYQPTDLSNKKKKFRVCVWGGGVNAQFTTKHLTFY